MARLSRAADYSRLSLAAAAVLATAGGASGRRAAKAGLASVGVTATIINLVFKPLSSRRRPDRVAQEVRVACSRAHTGVDSPGDVIVGSLLGVVLAQATVNLTDRLITKSS